MKKVTIKDLAKMADVSAATVSMVLNNKANISEATRRKIKELAAEHNYVPNVAARGLVSSKTNVIGVVIPNVEEPMNAATLRAITDEMSQTDYSLMLYDPVHAFLNETSFYNQISREGRIDGIIQRAVEMTESDRQFIEKLRIPVVVIENEFDWVDCIHINNIEGCYNATTYLVKQGHKKIGVISCEGPAKNVITDRLEGVKAALSDAGLSLDERHVYNTSMFKINQGLGAADYFHSLRDKPTAIFSIAGDWIAYGFMSRIKKLGYQIPGDFALIGFDDLEISSYSDPSLTTLRQPLQKMAKGAIDLLIARLQDPDKPFEIKRFDAEFILRESA